MVLNDKQIFYENLKKLKTEFENCDKEIDNLKQNFESSISTLLKKVQKNSSTMKTNMKSKEISEFLDKNVVLKITDALVAWEKNKKEAISRKILRDNTNDSFLIIVYGKVKAGKSTLGNYIADNYYTDVKAKKSFFIFDTAGKEQSAKRLEEIDEDSFATKSTECTNSIQGFKIPGLTWVDTPGLMSMTPENGELAKKYIEAADLIIYPMSSDSPGRATDSEELKELAKKGKEFLVIITKSDFEEEDEIGEEIISALQNLSDEDRNKQEQWVKSELNKKLSDLKNEFGIDSEKQLIDDVFSISVAVAEKYPEKTIQWEKSNIPLLYKKLNKIIEKDALRLKKEQPLNNIKAELRKYITKTENESLYKIKDGLSNQIDFLNNKIDIVKNSNKIILNEFSEIIDITVETAVRDGYETRTDSKTLASNINEVVQSEINNISKSFLKKTLVDISDNYDFNFPSYEINDSILEFKPKTKTIEITNETITRGVGSAVGGAGGTVGGALLGGLIGSAVPVIGTTIGAVVGGAVGGMVGAGAGSAVGDGFKTISYKDIVVGDNLDEVIYASKKEAEKLLNEHTDLIINFAINEIINPLKKILKETENDIDAAIDTISKRVK